MVGEGFVPKEAFGIFSRNLDRRFVSIEARLGITSGGGLKTGQHFTDLADVPVSYSSYSLRHVRVNTGETGLEFAEKITVSASVPSGGINGDLWFQYDTDLLVGGTGANGQVAYWTGVSSLAGSANFLWNGSKLRVSGVVTDNTKMTQGVAVDQGANDDDILSFCSSDVAHGMTARMNTEVYGSFLKVIGADGGLKIQGAIGGTTYPEGLNLVSYAKTCNTTKSTAGVGHIELIAAKISGTDVADVDADANILTIRCRRGGAWETVFIVDEDGDYYYDGTGTGYDEHDDALACLDASHVLAKKWDKILKYKKEKLIEMGVISEGGFVSGKKLNMLLMGAVGQLYNENKILKQRLGVVEQGLVRRQDNGLDC